MRIIGNSLLGLILGAIVTAVLAIVAIPVFDISQMEGAYAMGVAFFYIPMGAVAGAVAGVIWAIVRRPRNG